MPTESCLLFLISKNSFFVLKTQYPYLPPQSPPLVSQPDSYYKHVLFCSELDVLPVWSDTYP